MKTKLLPIAVIFATTPLGAIAASSPVVATINGKTITLKEFNSRFQENAKFFRFGAPSKIDVLNEMIKRELGTQEARRIGLHKDPNVVERMNTVLYSALLEKKLAKEFSKLKVSTREAKQYYAKNPEIRTSHVFVAIPPGATKEQEKKAYSRIKDVKDKQLKQKNVTFAEVAQRFSEDRSAPLGGDLDYQTKDQLDPAYYAAAVRLRKPGRTSGIVKSQFGYHVIRLTAVRKWTEVDQEKIKRLAFEEKRKKIFDNYLAKLRRKARVSINKKLLR